MAVSVTSNTHEGSVTVVNHFLYPDDVVSARLISDFCEELVQRNWRVKILTSNRYCRKSGYIIEKTSTYKGASVVRIFRPGLDQSNNYLRLLNTFWLFLGIFGKIVTSPPTNFYIIGSDPPFLQFMFPLIKLFRPKSKVVFWCYDLHPESITALLETPVEPLFIKTLKLLLKKCYRFADLIVDIGPYMKERLDQYSHKAQSCTMVPWALVEPSAILPIDEKARTRDYGLADLVVLYSGNMGQAHDYDLFLELARQVYIKQPGIVFAFGCRGNRLDDLKNAILQSKNDANVRLLPFVDESELESRLASADIHMLSLKSTWAGVVVPSKFFGSLSIGRPVLYSGKRESDIGQWITEFDVGLILDEFNVKEIADRLIEFSENRPKLWYWQKQAFSTYHSHFSKKITMDKWENLLQSKR